MTDNSTPDRGTTPRRIRWPAVVVGGLALVLAGTTPAHAKGFGGFLAGLNGVLTAPADPVRHVISPPEDFDEVPVPEVSGRVLGIFSGTLLAGYRAATGALDIALTPLWVIPTLSPEPGIKLIPGSDERD
jgi:hypothetical protein